MVLLFVMKMKRFIERWVIGSPLIKKEGKFKVFPNGYRFNSNIFETGILIILALGFYIFYSVGFNIDTQIYVKCDQMIQCPNPFYKGSLDNIILDKYKDDCIYDWCNQEYLPAGFEFGHKPGFLIRSFGGFVFLIIGICFILNHLLFNKDFNSEIELEDKKD